MSRVHDKADKSVSGKWVGRSLELVEKPTAAGRPLKWWVLQ